MGQPTQGDVHVNGFLTNLSLAWMQEEASFVADRVFPVIPVSKQSDLYAIYSRADFNRNGFRKRAAGAQSAGSGYRVSNSTYTADVWALHRDIDDQTRANADFPFNLDADATKYLTQQAMINKEQSWATAFFNSGLWTTDITGVTSGATAGTSVQQWDDYTGSTPIADIRDLKNRVQLAGLMRPNKMVLGRQVFDKLCDHPDFIERIKFGGTNDAPAQVAKRAMAQLFELEEVLVMDGIVNNGEEGVGPDSGGTSINATETNAFIGGKHVLLVYTPQSAGLGIPGSGFCYSWNGYLGASALGGRMKSFYIDENESTRVEMELAYIYQQTAKEMGAFISGAVS